MKRRISLSPQAGRGVKFSTCTKLRVLVRSAPHLTSPRRRGEERDRIHFTIVCCLTLSKTSQFGRRGPVLRGGCFLTFRAVGHGPPHFFPTVLLIPGTFLPVAKAASLIAMLAPMPTTATVAPGRAAAAKPAMANAAAAASLCVRESDFLASAITTSLRMRRN